MLGFSFFMSCASDATSTAATADETDANASTVAVETSTPTIKVDSAQIKKMIEEKEAELAEAAAVKAAAEKEEKEKLAAAEAEKREKEKRAEEKAAKRKLAELKRKKAEADKKAAEAAAASSTIAVSELPVSKPVIKPAPPKTPVKQKGAKIKFDTKTHSFGTIKEGDVVKYEFYYTNTGDEDLVIKDASATCGCTAPGFSFFPLAPGLSSAISVTFNSANKAGAQRPEVTIITNGYPSKHVLTLEGVVEK